MLSMGIREKSIFLRLNVFLNEIAKKWLEF